MIHTESAKVCRRPHQILSLHPAKRQSRASNSLLVQLGDVCACENNGREDHPRVGRIRADLGELAPRDRVLDPGGRDHRNHHVLRLHVLVKVDRVRDDVRNLGNADLPLAIRFKDLGAMVLHNLRELPKLSVSRRKRAKADLRRIAYLSDCITRKRAALHESKQARCKNARLLTRFYHGERALGIRRD
jgi:hypothetical protein